MQLINLQIEAFLDYCTFDADITLSSGQKSDWYCDVKSLLVGSHGDDLIQDVHSAVLRIWLTLCDRMTKPQVLGIGYGGALLVGGLAAQGCEGVVVRTEKKDHGLKNALIGDTDFKEVIIVEDVVTTGGSVLKAIHTAESFRMQVIGVVTVVDRMSDQDHPTTRALMDKYNLVSLITEEELQGFRNA